MHILRGGKEKTGECSIMLETFGKVYLAGPITGLDFEGATDWRIEVTKLMRPIEALSPMRYKSYLAQYGKLRAQYENTDIRHPLSTDQGITTRDRWDVQRCDLILMNFLGAERVSVGTCIEVGWGDAYRKPIILVMEREGNLHEHGMIQSIIGYRVETLEEAVDITKALLLPAY